MGVGIREILVRVANVVDEFRLKKPYKEKADSKNEHASGSGQRERAASLLNIS